MAILKQPTVAPPARTDATKQLSYLLAGFIVIMLVAQLFTFDTFIDFFTGMYLPVSYAFAFSLAPLIVALELFSLPFLLHMKLSPAFRWLSMVCGWLAMIVWLYMSVWTTTVSHGASSVGFLGTVIDITPGWWSVFLMISICIITAWVSWGMWPYKSSHKTHTHRGSK